MPATIDQDVVDERQAPRSKAQRDLGDSVPRPLPARPESTSAIRAPQRRTKSAHTVEHARPEAPRPDDPARATARPPESTSTIKPTRLRRLKHLKVAHWHPCRTLAWRWESAVEIAESERDVLTHLDPPEVADAVEYLRARGRDESGREHARERWRDLDDACTLAQESGPRRWEVEARILARQTDETIAARVGLTPATIRYYQRLFFSVREFLGAADWVTVKAVGWGPFMLRLPTLGEIWKGLAYHGGAHVLELVIATTMDRPFPDWTRTMPGAGDPTFEERLRLRCQLVLDGMLLPFDVDPLKLGRLHLDLLAREAVQRAEEPLNDLQTRVDEMLAETSLPPQARPAGDTQAAGVA